MKIRGLVLAAALGVALPAAAQTDSKEAAGDAGQQQSAAKEEKKEERKSAQSRPFDARIGEVQNALRQFGFNPGPLDGVMGSRTRAALREFQKDRGLEVTGELDPQTLAALHVTTPGGGGSSAGASVGSGAKPRAGGAGGGPAADGKPSGG